MEKPTEFSKKLPSEYLPWIIQSTIQNRISAVLAVLWIGGVCFSNNEFSPITWSICIILQGTACWFGANDIFDRTCEHIDQFGSLDPNYFKAVLWENINKPYNWYCSLQWMYLAAKKYGIEDQFFELKKQYSWNKIPNF